MKIELELPDWATGTIFIHSDKDLVAYKVPGKEMKVKKVRCDQCGECCLSVPDGWFSWGSDGGKCNYVKKVGDKWICTAGHEKPFNCCTVVTEKNCTIEWE
jgi:hypothetical protein